ncbi:MAG: gamma carbonic anhydrase family protein [Alphaproteobacteria bacterium]|nr:gamma carbonic anhydrase family protein [Alphaproteobacteria bacterium]
MATILPYKGVYPSIAEDAWVAPTAAVLGDVEIGARSSIWFGCTVRGDVNVVRIGKNTNIQDNSVIHVDRAKYGTFIGDDVLIGHMCLIHACTIGDRAMVGMKACVMDGAVVEPEAMVAAGALVTPGKVVKSRELWAGSPAKHMRDLSDEDIAGVVEACLFYAEYAEAYRLDLNKAAE